ncbi:MAG: isoprenylcysteine carboxylmethyltransferase family protein [Anaerolineales bacterium]|nr:isoprenylcysteine carboxylmethyltransferase family protein [Anaerolineales bacterium]
MSEHKDHADVKIHPPVLTLIFLVIAYLAKRFIPLPFDVPAWLQTFGFILVVSGFLLALAAIWEFMKAKTTVNPHGSVSNIISSGIFRFTRNPIYLGFVLMLIGFPLYFDTYWGIILAPVLILCFNTLVIQHEEAYLEKKFGEQYTSYKSRVRRWL